MRHATKLMEFGVGAMWCFLSGVGSVLSLAPAVRSPVLDNVELVSGRPAGAIVDAAWIASYWQSVGRDVASATDVIATAA